MGQIEDFPAAKALIDRVFRRAEMPRFDVLLQWPNGIDMALQVHHDGDDPSEEIAATISQATGIRYEVIDRGEAGDGWEASCALQSGPAARGPRHSLLSAD